MLGASGLFALFSRTDPDHEPLKEALFEDSEPYLVPDGILAEFAYLVERRLRTDVLESFTFDLEARGFILHCGEKVLPRIREQVWRYADLPLGFSEGFESIKRAGASIPRLDPLLVRAYFWLGAFLPPVATKLTQSP